MSYHLHIVRIQQCTIHNIQQAESSCLTISMRADSALKLVTSASGSILLLNAFHYIFRTTVYISVSNTPTGWSKGIDLGRHT